MKTSSLQSPPSATPDAANDALSGLIVQAGKNQKIKILNTDVVEVDGMWIATAFFEIEEMDDENENDENLREENKERLGVDPQNRDDLVLWHALSWQEQREASPAQDIPAVEGGEPNPEDYELQVVEDTTSGSGDGDRIAEETIKASDDLQKEFAKAEEAETTLPIDASVAALQPAYYDHAPTFEERREEAERIKEEEELAELERLRREAVPLQVEEAAPTEPAPSDS